VRPATEPPAARRGRGPVVGPVLLGIACLVGGGAGPLLAPRVAQARARPPAVDPAARRDAIRRGCAYLASEGKQGANGGFGEDKAIVATTALCVLALMADGSTDGRGPYGHEVSRGIDFLVNLVEHPTNKDTTEGYFYYTHDNNSRMHGQGYATLALASALGTSTGGRYARIHAVLEKAVACIEGAQTRTGGFGYEPVANQEHEGSVTVTVAQGLRAARDAGIHVNRNLVEMALRYLERSQKPDDGSFRYSLYVDRSSYALTAAALSSFFLYGRYRDDASHVLQRGLDYLMDQLDDVQKRSQWYYYGNFYAGWACWQVDGNDWDSDTGYWSRWHRRIYPDLLARQRRADGGWDDPYDRFEFGDLVPTAFAILTLAIPDEVLPIFQR
jgi:hypothetical protein